MLLLWSVALLGFLLPYGVDGGGPVGPLNCFGARPDEETGQLSYEDGPTIYLSYDGRTQLLPGRLDSFEYYSERQGTIRLLIARWNPALQFQRWDIIYERQLQINADPETNIGRIDLDDIEIQEKDRWAIQFDGDGDVPIPGRYLSPYYAHMNDIGIVRNQNRLVFPAGSETNFEFKARVCVRLYTDGPTCNPGSQFVGGQCVLCPVGYYSPRTDGSQCTKCSPGFTTLRSGSTQRTECIACPRGTFEDDGVCRSCSVDFYQPSSGATSCIRCPSGTSTNGEVGSDQCFAVSACNPGNQLVGGQCVLCPVGYYSPRTDGSQCSKCSPGFTTLRQGATQPTECLACPRGTFEDGGACRPCRVDYFQPNTGRTSCIECPIGTSTQGEVGSAQCVAISRCSVGQELINNICSDCRIGYFASHTNGSPCVKCQQGFSTSTTRSDSPQDCFPCNPGFFERNGACIPCAPDFYQPQNGQTSCLPCPPGTSTDGLTGRTQCILDIVCPRGQQLINGVCVNCPTGYYSDRTDGAACNECPQGFSTSGTGSDSFQDCFPCQAGLFESGGLCIPCAVDFYQPQTGRTSCIPCAAGTSTLGQTGRTQCTVLNVCPPGQHFVNGGCVLCDRGFYSSRSDDSPCVKCPAGYTTGARGSDSALDCFPCPEGQYETGGVCIPCPVDFYQPEAGSTTCRPCETGSTTQGQTGRRECIANIQYIKGQKGEQGPQGLRGQRGDTGNGGATGSFGAEGAKGDQGVRGATGARGATGSPGFTGPKGAAGARGPTGPSGDQGSPGEKGLLGPVGETGSKGLNGADGLAGQTGADGPKGFKGSRGFRGNRGDKGDIGDVGLPGATGGTAENGDKGNKGSRGPFGTQGSQGSNGARGTGGSIGDRGPAGFTGDKGRAGDRGFVGREGPDGPDGAIGGRGDFGGTGARGPSGVRGIVGDRGFTGVKGVRGVNGIPGRSGPPGVMGPLGAAGTNVGWEQWGQPWRWEIRDRANIQTGFDGYIDMWPEHLLPNGLLLAVQFYARSAGSPINIQVWRMTEDGRYQLIHQQRYTPTYIGEHTVTLHPAVPTRLGDRIGFSTNSLRGVIPYDILSATTTSYSVYGSSVTVGQVVTPRPTTQRRYSFKAIVQAADEVINICNTSPCSHDCTVVGDGYVCSCPENYRLAADQHTCILQSPCANNPCSHQCVVQGESFVCTCPDGMALGSDGFTCQTVVVNPCLNHPCEHSCRPIGNQFVCECRSGYQLAQDTTSCIDVNECLSGNGGCQITCRNTEGSFQCSCPAGYNLASDRRTCIDINECLGATNPCGSRTCTNTEGSYTCLCGAGYRFNEVTGACENINECAIPELNGCQQGCFDFEGGYQCTCRPGYTRSGLFACVDVNECAAGTHNCGQFANCLNTIGSFTCSGTGNFGNSLLGNSSVQGKGKWGLWREELLLLFIIWLVLLTAVILASAGLFIVIVKKKVLTSKNSS